MSRSIATVQLSFKCGIAIFDSIWNVYTHEQHIITFCTYTKVYWIETESNSCCNGSQIKVLLACKSPNESKRVWSAFQNINEQQRKDHTTFWINRFGIIYQCVRLHKGVKSAENQQQQQLKQHSGWCMRSLISMQSCSSSSTFNWIEFLFFAALLTSD